jgi:hypothetical protein
MVTHTLVSAIFHVVTCVQLLDHDHHGSGGKDVHAPKKHKKWRPSSSDMDKVYTTIKQFTRDWSSEVSSDCCPITQLLIIV